MPRTLARIAQLPYTAQYVFYEAKAQGKVKCCGGWCCADRHPSGSLVRGELAGYRSGWLSMMKSQLWLSVLVAAGLSELGTRPARACGVSASGVSSCSLAEHDEAVRPRWAVGVSGLYTSTRLHFGDELYADQVRYATLATLAYLPTAKLVLEAGVGAAFGGSLTLPDGRYQFSPGPTALLGADFRAFDDGRYFLILTSGLSFASARTHATGQASESYTAFDLRLGAEFGIELARIVRPYAVARVFGGPVFWHYQDEAVTGTDTQHYQLGAGVAVRVSKALNLFAEGIPLGEQAVAVGAGLAL
ncbi:MAG: hypothetical protein WDO69_26950 [Pseudomonadota bacterium]